MVLLQHKVQISERDLQGLRLLVNFDGACVTLACHILVEQGRYQLLSIPGQPFVGHFSISQGSLHGLNCQSCQWKPKETSDIEFHDAQGID
jgi:hypothetical protein